MNQLKHFVNGRIIRDSLNKLPLESDESLIIFGMGCFWGAEKKFWNAPNVRYTAVGYAGGSVEDPGYEAVCSGATGHAEVVAVVFIGGLETLTELLKIFWENHDPTQGMRQGNDIGTQYRSAIYCSDQAAYDLCSRSFAIVQKALTAGGYPQITTELSLGATFYFAEEYHQQYLAKNPDGYCGLGGTGVSLAEPLLVQAQD